MPPCFNQVWSGSDQTGHHSLILTTQTQHILGGTSPARQPIRGILTPLFLSVIRSMENSQTHTQLLTHTHTTSHSHTRTTHNFIHTHSHTHTPAQCHTHTHTQNFSLTHSFLTASITRILSGINILNQRAFEIHPYMRYKGYFYNTLVLAQRVFET